MDMIWAFCHLVLYTYAVVALSLCCQPVSPSLLLGCFLSDCIVLGLCALLQPGYQFYHTIHESIALIFQRCTRENVYLLYSTTTLRHHVAVI